MLVHQSMPEDHNLMVDITKGKQVIQGPGENAGVIDIGDNDAIIFKIERAILKGYTLRLIMNFLIPEQFSETQ